MIFSTKLERQRKSKEWAKFVKTATVNAGTSGLIQKRNFLQFLTLHLLFCLLIRKKKYSNWMAILSTLESTTLDKTIRWASKWLTLTNKRKKKQTNKQNLKLKQNKTKQNEKKTNKNKNKKQTRKTIELIILKCVTYAEPFSLSESIKSLPQRIKALISKLKFGSPLSVRKLDYRLRKLDYRIV